MLQNICSTCTQPDAQQDSAQKDFLHFLFMQRNAQVMTDVKDAWLWSWKLGGKDEVRNSMAKGGCKSLLAFPRSLLRSGNCCAY